MTRLGSIWFLYPMCVLIAGGAGCDPQGPAHRPATTPAPTPANMRRAPARNVTAKKTVRTVKTAGAPLRSAVPAKYKWRLELLYPTTATWREGIAALEAALPGVRKCRGGLASSAARLRKCLDLVFSLRETGIRLWAYTWCKHHQDMRVDAHKGLLLRAQKLRARVQSAIAFVDPELLAVDVRKLQRLSRHRLLVHYDQYLTNLIRRRAHVLTREGESILAKMAPPLRAAAATYRTLTTTELPFPQVKLAGGRMATLSFSLVGKYQRHRIRSNRVAVLSGLLQTYAKHRRTLASLLSTQVRGQLAMARARRYGSQKPGATTPPSLAQNVAQTGVPAEIYHALIRQAGANRHLVHRWSRTRKRLLGLKQLSSFDGVSVVPKPRTRFSYDRALSIIASALAPMGKKYVAQWLRATAPGSGMIDAMPNRGKLSGNFQLATTGKTRPLILLNWHGGYGALSMLAHETGHAMHTILSNAAQPLAKARYSSFVSEVSSLTHEALVVEYLVRNASSKKERLAYMASHVGQFLSKVFRMARYAELELRIHQWVDQKGGITADVLDRISLALLRTHEGHAKGVKIVDKVWASEWALIPHLYRGFALYRYATSFVAATVIARKIITGGFGPRYVERFLRAGGSKEPLALLQDLGVDLKGGKAYSAAFAVMKERMDAIDRITATR